jgi:hypothetical protein
MKEKPQDIKFHYTNESMVKWLLSLTPIEDSDVVLDAGSGKNKVWYNSLTNPCKFECELEDGCDFMQCESKVDWVVGNPPFHIGWGFTEKAMTISKKGVAFLLNNTGLNSTFTPKRIEWMQSQGFYLQRIQVVSDKRWFGRYYYLIFTKQKNDYLGCIRQTF